MEQNSIDLKEEIKQKGEKLLETHSNLYPKLLEIPKTRKLTYRIDLQDGKKMGKPRFEPKKYQWNPELHAELRDHLENIWNFFESYSFWFDDTIFPIISYEKRRTSKKSIIFLLENDLYKTDEVYGDYLIQKQENGTRVSYTRRDKLIKTFNLPTTDNSEIEKFIRKDAVRQIQEQFTYLWKKIANEIKTNLKESYKKTPKELLSSAYLKEELQKLQKILPLWHEGVMLGLGRITELWILLQLEMENKPFGKDINRQAKKDGLLTNRQFKLLGKIKNSYDRLKHRRNYSITKKEVENLLTLFFKLFSTKQQEEREEE
jgi:hypothetical protein